MEFWFDRRTMSRKESSAVPTPNRRQFIREAAATCAALSIAAATSSRRARASSVKVAPGRVVVDTERIRGSIDRRLFGSFVEHLGRCVYQGIYEPGNRLSDSKGFRKDVAEEIRAMAVPIVRYPGGNFVSGYHWLDGIGPKKDRPKVLERAWNSIETNQFGTNEFMEWCKLVGTQPLLGMNFGTAGAEDAANLLEYCNVEKGTKWSDLRRKHGYETPHKVKSWCLGNEMDGPWQIGHMTAVEYGRKALDAARQMRLVDRNIELIACGSSGPGMQTYIEWDQQVLEECYGEVDAISLHRYFNNTSETGSDSSKYLAMNLSFEKQIMEIASVCDTVQARQRSRKRLWLSFDEWNVWYRARNGNGERKEAPHLLEEVYNLEDALLVGGLLNSLVRHSDRVTVACLAQLVNVIAPLMTNETSVLRQTIYYPYLWALRHARGIALDLLVECDTYQPREMGRVGFIDAAATHDPNSGDICILLLNRDIQNEREIKLEFLHSAPSKVAFFQTITGPDLKASNTFEAPNRVVPHTLEAVKPGSAFGVKLPAQSYSVLVLAP